VPSEHQGGSAGTVLAPSRQRQFVLVHWSVLRSLYTRKKGSNAAPRFGMNTENGEKVLRIRRGRLSCVVKPGRSQERLNRLPRVAVLRAGKVAETVVMDRPGQCTESLDESLREKTTGLFIAGGNIHR